MSNGHSDIVDLTALPTDISLENVKQHISDIESQILAWGMDIEDARHKATSLKRKLENINTQMPEAENKRAKMEVAQAKADKDLADAVAKMEAAKAKADRDLNDAVNEIRGLERTADEFGS